MAENYFYIGGTFQRGWRFNEARGTNLCQSFDTATYLPAHAPFDVTNPVYRRISFERLALFMETVCRALAFERDIEWWHRSRARDADSDQPWATCRYAERSADHYVPTSHIEEQASRVWSRTVRARVKALPPPGPPVYCQTEED